MHNSSSVVEEFISVKYLLLTLIHPRNGRNNNTWSQR